MYFQIWGRPKDRSEAERHSPQIWVSWLVLAGGVRALWGSEHASFNIVNWSHSALGHTLHSVTYSTNWSHIQRVAQCTSFPHLTDLAPNSVKSQTLKRSLWIGSHYAQLHTLQRVKICTFFRGSPFALNQKLPRMLLKGFLSNHCDIITSWATHLSQKCCLVIHYETLCIMQILTIWINSL